MFLHEWNNADEGKRENLEEQKIQQYHIAQEGKSSVAQRGAA